MNTSTTKQPGLDKIETTHDGRYIIVKGRLWRTSNPNLSEDMRQACVNKLMDARRAVYSAQRKGDKEALIEARKGINEAKHALGERGPVWWTDGSKDYNKHLVKNTPYAQEYAEDLPKSSLVKKMPPKPTRKPKKQEK